MRLPLRLLLSPRAGGIIVVRRFASLSLPPYGRTASYRRICGNCDITKLLPLFPNSQSTFLTPPSYVLACLLSSSLSTTSRSLTTSGSRRESRAQSDKARDPPRPASFSHENTENEDARASAHENSKGSGDAKKSSTGNSKGASEESRESSDDSNDGSNKQSDTKGKQKEAPPPPPPHGDKTPWQVFKETLSQEFQASKEWHESTKALASSAHQFTENESVKRARAAYTAASGAATSTTSSALKGTGKVLGQGAAWTWDTPVVKGVRSGVAATGRGIEKVTRPVRETKVYKTTVGGVKEVIDDGSSSRYGGWIEKEERRKQRELRELNEATANGKVGKGGEKIEEDPKSVFYMLHPSSLLFRVHWIC